MLIPVQKELLRVPYPVNPLNSCYMPLTLRGKGWGSKVGAEIIGAWLDFIMDGGLCLVSTLSETPHLTK